MFMKNILQEKIVYKIFFMFILTISIPAVLLLLYSYNTINSTIMTDFIKYKQSLNHQAAASMDENIGRMMNESASLIYNLDDLRNYLNYKTETMDENYFSSNKKITFFLTSILSNNDRYDGIGLVNMDGYLVRYLNWDNLTPKNTSIKNDIWITDAINSNGNPVVNIFDPANIVEYDKRPGKVIAVTRTINDYNNSNRPIGISIFCQSIVKFGEITFNGRITDGETMLILGKDNELIYSSQKVSTSQVGQVLEFMDTMDEISGYYNIDKEQVFIISDSSSKFGFKVISFIPEYIFRNKMSGVQKINFLLIAIITLSIILISILLSNIITNPLKRLMYSYKRLEQGDFDAAVSVKGRDEFAEICRGFNSMVINIKNLIRQKYEIDLLRKQSELEALQSKINPHFLYNTLTSLKAVIENKDYENSHLMVQNLSDIFRYSLNRGKFIVHFTDELEHMEKYLKLQQLRYGQRVKIMYDIDKEILQFPILRLTLQPIVENALIHGLDSISSGGKITISGKICNDIYCIYIEDNGIGISTDKLKEMNAILSENPEMKPDSLSKNLVGIYNVNSRIKFYFGNDYGIKVMGGPGQGTTVRISLPVNDTVRR